MAKRPSIAIVGAGRLGGAILRELTRKGYRITEVVARDAAVTRRKIKKLLTLRVRVTSYDNARLEADLVWFCVLDAEIAEAARALAGKAGWKGKHAFHSSGALTSDELMVLRRRGAHVASVHPLMTFVHKSAPSLHGVPFGLEGDRAALSLAKRIVQDLDGIAFTIPKARKTAYHAWGSFASPLLVALLVTAEEVAEAAGVPRRLARKRMLPILNQTLRNYENLGPAGAFSGPIIRGDVETVRRHRAALEQFPEAWNVYVALAASALKHLPAENKQKLNSVVHS